MVTNEILGWFHRCSPTDGSVADVNSDGRADLGHVTKLLLLLFLLLVRFATFLSAILSGMWAEWLPFSLNRYVKHACACVCVAWLNLCLNPAGFFFSLFAAELVSGWPRCPGPFCALSLILSLSSSPAEFPGQNDICALRGKKKRRGEFKVPSLHFWRCWDASPATDSPVLWSASAWCSAAAFASCNKTLDAA